MADHPIQYNEDNCRKKNTNIWYIMLNVLYYSMFVVLLGFLIIPHTSFHFKSKLYAPLSMRLNKDDIVLVKGEEEKLFVIGINKRVRFTSTDFKVADVTFSGGVIAKRVGTTIIRAEVDNRILKCRVRVISMNKTSLSLSENDTYTLKVKGVKGIVKWSSSNKSVVSVSRKGAIKACKKGSAVIKAKIKGATVSCKVVVK